MKKIIVCISSVLLLSACGNKAEKAAQVKLAIAREAMQREDYAQALQNIDSIKILYPKAFDTRRESLKLKEEIEIRQQTRNLSYLDTIMKERINDFNNMKGRFILEKDAEYQETGNFFWPTQITEKNLHRTFLRFQVSERGELVTTSIYCGKSSLQHFAVRVTTPDGTFCETPRTRDSYFTEDNGEKIEKADYRSDEDNGLVPFIASHKNEQLKVTFIGNRKYQTIMPEADKQAAAEILAFSNVIKGIIELQKQKEEANLKLNFINRKQAEDAKREKEEAED